MGNVKTQTVLVKECVAALNAALAGSKDIHVDFHIHQVIEPYVEGETCARFHDTVVIDRIVTVPASYNKGRK